MIKIYQGILFQASLLLANGQANVPASVVKSFFNYWKEKFFGK